MLYAGYGSNWASGGDGNDIAASRVADHLSGREGVDVFLFAAATKDDHSVAAGVIWINTLLPASRL